jgi:Alkylmercury lyase
VVNPVPLRVLDARIGEVDGQALVVRNLTYALFVELGRAPSAEEVGQAAELAGDEVVAVWRDLHRVHALVLNPATTEIRMANPFSAVPTAYRVLAAGRWWYGNCAWDALGICAALRADGRIETSCPDCGEVIVLEVRDRRVDDERLLFHCLVPASQWWDDIIFT